MGRLIFYPLAAAIACGATPAYADDAVAGAADAEPIIVTGQSIHYGVRATSTATKTKTPIKDIPQALTTVSAAQIEDQQLRSVADLLNFVPGAAATRARATPPIHRAPF